MKKKSSSSASPQNANGNNVRQTDRLNRFRQMEIEIYVEMGIHAP